MKIVSLISTTMTFLFVVYFIEDVYGKKKLEKKIIFHQNDNILQKITVSLEKCVKKDKTISKKGILPHQFRKCLKKIKKQKSLSKDKKKTTKGFLKKVIKSINECLKSKNKNKDQSKSKKKQQKRSKRSKNFAEKMKEIDEEMKKMNLLLKEIHDHKDLEACGRKKCECGKSEYSSNARIYNGKTAFEKQFPWQLLIQVTYKNDKGEEQNPRAGGILVSRKHVLSVAHAFYHEKDSSRKINELEGLVIGGLYDTEDLYKTGPNNLQMIEFTQQHVRTHKGYIPTRGDPYLSFFDFDVALVSLPKLFSFNEYLKPICLPINKIKAIDEIGKLNGKPLTISGFGRTTQSGEPTKILQFAKVLKQNSDECFHDVFGTDAQFPPKWGKMKKEGFCYKGENSEISCYGDSGGPMIWEGDSDSERAYLVGVISQIHGKCEKPIHHSVAVFVPGEIFQWIMENEGTGKEISDCLPDDERTRETEFL